MYQKGGGVSSQGVLGVCPHPNISVDPEGFKINRWTVRPPLREGTGIILFYFSVRDIPQLVPTDISWTKLASANLQLTWVGSQLKSFGPQQTSFGPPTAVSQPLTDAGEPPTDITWTWIGVYLIQGCLADSPVRGVMVQF